MRNTKIDKSINIFIKIVIFVLSVIFIVYRLFYRNDAELLWNNLASIQYSITAIGILSTVFLLMLLNWFTESLKWKNMIKKVEPVSVKKAVVAVLAGITMGTITPNRAGENVARVFVLHPENRSKGIVITLLGGISQLMITVSLGISGCALAFFSSQIYMYSEGWSWIIWFSGIMFLIVFLFLCLIYFKFSSAENILNFISKNGLQRWKNFLREIPLYKKNELFSFLFLSLMRYVLFALQFYLLMLFCGIEISIYYAFIFISIMYLLLTAIPTITLAELGVRGAVGVFLIEIFFQNNTTLIDLYTPRIVLASFLIWLINLIIPALIGEFYLWKIKFVKK
jgi:hypothetical protein